ncbi:MAG: hypothetical protein ABIG46_00315 [Candidatus Omnitrophota bacterium]
MNKNKYLLLDNSNYLDYFINKLKDSYVPIVLEDQARSFLEGRGIFCVGIFDYLNSADIKDATQKALEASDALLSQIDIDNKQNYLAMFGTDEIRLLQSTADFLFKRFVMAVFRLVRGLEGILKNNNVSELAYLHDALPVMICGTAGENGFFFPDDITWSILNNWRSDLKPGLKLIKPPRRSSINALQAGNIKFMFRSSLWKLKAFLSPIKAFVLNSKKTQKFIDFKKNNLLFLYPFCDLSALLNSSIYLNDFNTLTWYPHSRSTDHLSYRPLSNKVNCTIKLNFTVSGFNYRVFSKDLDIKGLLVPLLERFYQEKIADMLYYWNQAQAIQNKNRIDMVLWGNMPHRYPAAILKEFFRIRRVPICGMQHGGLHASNFLGKLFFDSEFNRSDYYLSYGFIEEDLEGEMIDYNLKVSSKIIPTGSSNIKKFTDNLKQFSISDKREKVDLIFPVALVNKNFFDYFDEDNPRLFQLQKMVIDLLAQFSSKRVIIKFPPGENYLASPLGIYIQNKYRSTFCIIDDISFTDCLRKYNAKTIIIERQSTPLNESIVTDSNIVVYNDREWCSLTAKAHQMLSKRAIVCDDEKTFLSKISDCLIGKPEKRDILNREFIEKYCIYRGDPVNNIEKAILTALATNMTYKSYD